MVLTFHLQEKARSCRGGLADTVYKVVPDSDKSVRKVSESAFGFQSLCESHLSRVESRDATLPRLSLYWKSWRVVRAYRLPRVEL